MALAKPSTASLCDWGTTCAYSPSVIRGSLCRSCAPTDVMLAPRSISAAPLRDLKKPVYSWGMLRRPTLWLTALLVNEVHDLCHVPHMVCCAIAIGILGLNLPVVLRPGSQAVRR